MQSDDVFQWPRPTFLSKDLSGGRVCYPDEGFAAKAHLHLKRPPFYKWPGLYPDEGFVAKAHLPYE